jgi:SecD/SecF fusion protein
MGNRRRLLFVILSLAGLAIVLVLIYANRQDKDGIELVYRSQPAGEAQTIDNEGIEDAIGIIRARTRSLGLFGASVSRLGATEIKVNLPDVPNASRAVQTLGSPAQLYMYGWEPNLLGPEQAIGTNPGEQPPLGPLKASERRWREAGRDVSGFASQQLILSGAFPTAYTAALLASEQEPRACEECSSGGPRFYLFDRIQPHRLIAGPEPSKEGLYASPTPKERPRRGIVVEVPAGTTLVSEQPSDERGETEFNAEPGWYAIKDNPALSGIDITNPRQGSNQMGQPSITFGFTDQGREAFHELTREIAQWGQARTIGPVSAEQASALSGHFAMVLDNEVKARPIVNFAENPDGIDGRSGAEISGGFRSPNEARELATTLQIGALPIPLQLVRQR